VILAECANVLLSNLSVVDPSFVRNVLEDIDNCTISHYRTVFEDSLKFFEENGQFPDKEYLSIKHLEFIKTDVPFSDSVKLEFERLFKKEVITFKASELIQRGELLEAGDLLSVSRQTGAVAVKKIGLEGIIEEYDRLSEGPSGLLTAVPEIDELSKGCSYSTVTIIAAPPGHGKTTAAMSTMYMNSVKNDLNGIYLTLEVSERDWWYSLLSRHSLEIGLPISAETVKKGLLSAEERESLEKVRDDLVQNMKGKIQLFTVEDFIDFSFGEMERKFTKMQEVWGTLDYVIVDYINLFRFYRPKHMTPEEYVNNIIRFFGQFAIKANFGKGCVMLLLTQVNREGEKKLGKTNRGSMSQLAEFNELERTAHLAVVLYSSEQDRLSNQIGVSIVKNRTGLVREELQKAYADFEHFVIGSSEFSGIFSLDSVDLLNESDEGSLFN
jgi:replicative DNA helicase